MKSKMKVEKISLISLLQLVVFVNVWRTKVDAKMVEGCIESQLTLSCNEAKVINVSSVVLGDSTGCFGTNCCPKNDSCTKKPNDNHVNYVHRQCNGRQRCTVSVIREAISCPYWIGTYNTDFERIVYDCIDNRTAYGCGSSWTLFPDMNIFNRTLQPNETTEYGCRIACYRNDICRGIDFAPNKTKGQQCFLQLVTEPKSQAEGVRHWDYNRTAPCTEIITTTTDALKTTLSTDKREETWTFTYYAYTDEPEHSSVTGTSNSEDAVTPNEPEMQKGTEPMPIIIGIVCLLVLVIIIVLIIVIIKRKKHPSKTKPEVEMTGVRNGQNGIGLYANQNQDTNGNPNLRQNDRQNCTSTTYEEPNNVEYSVVNHETRPAADGAGVEYCDIDIIKSDKKTPATKPADDDGYSLAGDPDAPNCVENVYEDVESKQSDSKATKPVNIRNGGGGYEEPQAVSCGQGKLQQERRPCPKDEKSVSNSKADEGIYKNIGEVGTPSSPSSPYEPMTQIPSQSVYANESAVPFRTDSLTSSLGSGSEAHTPYCDMRSPTVKLKDDGAHMLVDNDLYSSH